MNLAFPHVARHAGCMLLGIAGLNAVVLWQRARRAGASPSQQRRVALGCMLGLGLTPALLACGAAWEVVLLGLAAGWMTLAAWVFLFGGAETLARLKLLRWRHPLGSRPIENPRAIRLLVAMSLAGALLGVGALVLSGPHG